MCILVRMEEYQNFYFQAVGNDSIETEVNDAEERR